MKRMVTLEESKSIQLQMLQNIHEYCVNNKITYYLMYGTLLGAVRHKGFIPWDDDIDICMPRKDYQMFISSYKSEHYKIVSCETDSSYYSPVGKVIDTRTEMKEPVSNRKTIGVFIDVFALDNRPDNESDNARLTKKVRFWRNVLAIKMNPGSDKRKGVKKYLHYCLNHILYINMNLVSRKINSLAQTYSNKKTSRYGVLSNNSDSDMLQEFPQKWFSETVLLEFESMRFYCPKCYHEILTYIYGDYMTLPPEQNRICPHSYETWWKT